MVGRDAWTAVYSMASRRNGTLYTGVTSQLVARVFERENPKWRDLSDGGFDFPADAITLDLWESVPLRAAGVSGPGRPAAGVT